MEHRKLLDQSLDLSKYISGFYMDDLVRAALCFREALVITLKDVSANDVEPVGEYCIQIESIGPQGYEFLVHVNSSMTVDSYLSGTKLISSMTDKLQCLEEKRIEFFVRKENGLYEKSLFMGLEEDMYHVETTYICPCNLTPLTEIKDTSLCRYEGFISEGANILLLRYLALTNYKGVLHLRNITIDGEIITSDYICNALQNMELQNQQWEVYTVERRIYKKNNLAQRNKTYLTSRGRILIYDCLDTPYIVQKDPRLMQDNINEIINLQIPLRNQWIQNIEMFSKYLNMKSHNVIRYTNYLVDHPEIKQLIADYVQILLVVKPINVIDFTIQHFKAFAREPKDWDLDLLIKQSDIDINQQILSDKSDVCIFCGICAKCKIVSQFETIF